MFLYVIYIHALVKIELQKAEHFNFKLYKSTGISLLPRRK